MYNIFQGSQEWVGLFIPASYGTVGTAMVLDGEGVPLREGKWDYERSDEGYTLWCDSSDVTGEASCIYQYEPYGSLAERVDLVGLEWSAVPEERDSPLRLWRRRWVLNSKGL